MMLTIAILVILSPAILIAGLFSLLIILGIGYSIISIPIGVTKKVKKDKEKDEK